MAGLLQPMALEIGSRLGHYAVTALIGEGGMDVLGHRSVRLSLFLHHQSVMPHKP